MDFFATDFLHERSNAFNTESTRIQDSRRLGKSNTSHGEDSKPDLFRSLPASDSAIGSPLYRTYSCLRELGSFRCKVRLISWVGNRKPSPAAENDTIYRPDTSGFERK